MTTNPFQYALEKIAAPIGHALWLYGDPGIAAGDVYHPYKDKADLLAMQGCRVLSDINAIEDCYDAIFVSCPKQREETEGLIALALSRSRGFVLAAAPVDAGGARLINIMKMYGIEAECLSKSRAKVVWTFQAPKADRGRAEQFMHSLIPKKIILDDMSWWSVPGLFGWNKIDLGSRLLLAHLPPDLKGRGADFGCGYGYLTVTVKRRYPEVMAMDAYDIDARAISCCALNGGAGINPLWRDLRVFETQPCYDFIVMNPPFHNGKREDTDLGRLFILKAWQSLTSGGRLFMVANRHLPYEKTVPGLAVIFENQNYKILAGRAP